MALSWFKNIAVRSNPVWQTRRRRRVHRLELEPLQDRILPSVDISLSHGILSIHADADPHQIQVLQANQSIQINDAGQPLGTYGADQVQLLVLQHGTGDLTFDNETALPAKELRLLDSSPLTPDQLSQTTGTLDALLVDNTLTLAGPSGAGFQISSTALGAWVPTSRVGGDGQITHTFTAYGFMSISTALGDFPFYSPLTDPLTVVTTATPQTVNFGSVATTHWSSGNPLDTRDPTSVLSVFSSLFGLQLTSSSPTFGVGLGRDLASLGAPLNPALPYLYFTTADAQAQFGQINGSVGPTNLLTVVLDPADPFLFAKLNEFSVGISLKGQVPFTPNLSLPDLGWGPLYGHLYGKGSPSFGDVPVDFSGEAVLNLDVQHDGALLQTVIGDVASYLITGQLDLSNIASIAPYDLRVGVNGHANIHYNQGGFHLNLPVDLSAEYDPGNLLLHATASGDIFAGTPLAFLGTSVSLDVTANIDTTGFDLVATTPSGSLGGFSGYGLTLEIGPNGVSASGTLHLQSSTLSADVAVTGNLQANGNYTLDGHAAAQFAGYGSGNAHFVLTNNGLSLDADANILIGSQTATVHLSSTGYIHPDGQFSLTGTASASFAGFSMPNATFTLNNSGLTAQGTVNAQIGSGSITLPFSGYVHTDGQFSLTGTASGQFSGFTLSNGHFGLNNTGLTADGTISVQLGSINVPIHFTTVGVITTTGGFRLDGHATATLVGGFVSVNAHYVVDTSGLTADGSVDIHLGTLAYSIPFTGWVHTDGQYQLVAHVASLNFGGFITGNVTLTLDNSGLTADASFALGSIVTASLHGTINFSGQYTLTGAAHVSFAGFTADASFSLSGSVFSVSAGVSLPAVGNVHMTGTFQTNGTYSLTFSGGFGISGFNGSGSLRLDTSGVTAHLDVGLPVLGLHGHLDGYIHSNGQYQLTASASMSLGPISGSLDLTLNNSGFQAHAHGSFDVTARVNGPWGIHLDVGFRIAVDASFSVRTDGTYNASGNFTATAYLGISMTVGIGFSLDNHTLTIRTGSIGFSIWGIGFHPFSDVVIHY